MVMTAIVTAIAAYMIGSVNFAVIYTKLFTKKDVRDFGSGNAGTTNAMRVGGKLPGILTFVSDAVKGFVASLLGLLIFKYMYGQGIDWAYPIYGAYLCGLTCMIGHVFPIFFEFKGGKGVAVSAGIFAICCPIAIAIGLAVFAALFIITKIVSISSLTATVVVVVFSAVFANSDAEIWPQLLVCIAMATIIFVKHRENIRRLLAGEESKMFGGKR